MPTTSLETQIELSREGNLEFEKHRRALADQKLEKNWMSKLSKVVFFKDIT
jgi:hypothetical protein